jgi:hypothetical protein
MTGRFGAGLAYVENAQRPGGALGLAQKEADPGGEDSEVNEGFSWHSRGKSWLGGSMTKLGKSANAFSMPEAARGIWRVRFLALIVEDF